MANTVESLAYELAYNWRKNYTLSGAVAFRANEAEKESILAKAEELGKRAEVMAAAQAIMDGTYAKA